MWLVNRSSPCVQGSEVSTSDFTQDSEPWAEALAQSAWWRGKPSAAPSWRNRCRRARWMTALSGAVICERFPSTNFRRSTGSPEATPASPSALQENGKERMILGTCGQSSAISSNLFDLEESSSRTSQAICPSDCHESSPTWKALVSAVRSASTQRRKLALRIEESASSSLAWPTPDATGRPHEGNVRLLRKGVEAGMDKEEADAMLGRDISLPQGKLPLWPTATVGDSRNSANATACREKTGHHSGTTLVDAVRLWPTPKASSGGPDPSNSTGKNLPHAVRSWPTPTAAEGNKVGNQVNKGQPGLSNHPEVRFWPTAAARDYKDGPGMSPDRGEKTGGRLDQLPRLVYQEERDGQRGQGAPSSSGNLRGLLNPNFVEVLMGYPSGWTDFERSATL